RGHRRCAEHRGGVAVSGVVPDGAPRVDCGAVEGIGPGQGHQGVCADGHGPRRVARARGRLGAADQRGRQGDASAMSWRAGCGRRPARNVDAELEFHLEMQTRRYEEAGLDHARAKARARERLGNLQDARDECRVITDQMETDMERSAWWQGVGQDVSYGLRLLRRTPTFTITALVTLAIGLGANTAIFSAVNTVLLKTVPYPSADRLTLIWNSYGSSLQHAAVAAPEFADIRAQQRAFDGVAAIKPQPSSLTGECGGDAGCEPERVSAYLVSSNVFDLLGVAPAMGRGFAEADGMPGAPRVVLLSDALW